MPNAPDRKNLFPLALSRFDITCAHGLAEIMRARYSMSE